MSTATLVGIDLGKHSFHLHGQDKAGREVFRKKTTRQQMMRLRLHEHFCYLDEQIRALDKEMDNQLAADDLGSRLLSIPCVGPITASLLCAEMGDGKQYGSSRDFAASVGLVPRQYSTGGRANLLGISKRGDKNLRRLLVQCARVYLQRLAFQQGAWPTGFARCVSGATRM